MSSSSTLLATKLLIPVRRPNLVPRLHLIERLDRGLRADHKLTLICASAGYGKTTLVTEWLHNAPTEWRADPPQCVLTRRITRSFRCRVDSACLVQLNATINFLGSRVGR